MPPNQNSIQIQNQNQDPIQNGPGNGRAKLLIAAYGIMSLALSGYLSNGLRRGCSGLEV